MSFGGKQHHHRFFTATKVRSRHTQGFASPQISRQRYQSVGPTHNPYLPSNYNHPQQMTMKQSYLRHVNNGINSRIFTKDQLGYEGLKFQKDVINRYSQNDYQKNSQIIEKFKRQAEQLKRKKKYHHVSAHNNMSQNYLQNDGMRSYRQQNQSIFKQNLPNHSISLLPITNKSPDKPFPYGLNYQNGNTSQVQTLPQLKLSKFIAINNTDKNFKDPVIQEDESNNQNQFLDNYENVSPIMSRVCDVGVNAHLSIDSQDVYPKKTGSKLSKNSQDFTVRKKSESLKLQMLKSKNKHLMKKYQKLKKQLSKKSKQLSKQRKNSSDQQNEHQFQQKIENLSQMIHSLCDKLKQNNSKLLVNINVKEQPYNENSYHMPLVQNKKTNKPLQQQKSAQINLQKPTELQKDQQKMSKLLTSKYNAQIQKIDSFRKTRPKIVYTFNKDSKNFNIDPLKLLKDKLKDQRFNQNMINNNNLIGRRRIKTQDSRNINL